MKFSNHQKETIKLIYSGVIYDIYSYLKYFKKLNFVKLSKNEIDKSFLNDSIPKTFYRRKNLHNSRANILTENEYQEKLRKKQIDSDNYIVENLKLNYCSGLKKVSCKDNSFVIDFYNGIYIPDNFNDILDFLVLWQYLKTEMLILEVPNKCSTETVGLFFEKSIGIAEVPSSLQEQLKCIDYSTFTYNDKYYTHGKDYVLSQEHFAMCEDYIGKKIYPSTRLSIFIKNNFKTYEETTQNRALFVAWLAIFVSVALTFLPYLHKEENPNLTSITEDIQDIKHDIDSSNLTEDIIKKLDTIIEMLSEIDNELFSNRLKNTTSPSSELN